MMQLMLSKKNKLNKNNMTMWKKEINGKNLQKG